MLFDSILVHLTSGMAQQLSVIAEGMAEIKEEVACSHKSHPLK